MIVFGLLLLFLGAPLLIGYYVGEKKNRSWRNLGIIMAVIGLLLTLIK